MQSVDRIVQLIDLLGTSPEGLPISQISRELDLSGSTIHRVLAALKKHGVVNQDESSRRYHLGLKILYWGGRLLDTNQVRTAAYSRIRELSAEFHACVFLSVLENRQTICIDTTANIKGNIHFYVKIGSLMPLNASASSQAIVAFLPDPMIDDLIEHEIIQPYTDKTICNADDLRKRMEEIRTSKYAVCDEELDRGVIAISVPIFNYANSVAASITVCDIKNKEQDIGERLKALTDTARNISISMGASAQFVTDFYR